MATEMRNALAALPKFTCSNVVETDEGSSFTVTAETRMGVGPRAKIQPGFTERRTICADGSLLVERI